MIAFGGLHSESAVVRVEVSRPTNLFALADRRALRTLFSCETRRVRVLVASVAVRERQRRPAHATPRGQSTSLLA